MLVRRTSAVPPLRRTVLGGLIALALAGGTTPVAGQSAEEVRAAVLAVADSALDAITRGDPHRLAELMLPEGLPLPVRDTTRYSVRGRDEVREQRMAGIVERGFDPIVQVAGALATVWLPYDLYSRGEWSHCGVDAFTLVRHDGAWRIALLSWTIQQPPGCEPHPDGPP